MSEDNAVAMVAAVRRQFRLPRDDEQFLEQQGLPWETVTIGQRWLLIHNFPVPAGYNLPQVSVALEINPSYPDVMIDMAYFYPALELTSGRAIANLCFLSIDGKAWQRWSRHRTGQNPWQIGVDCVATHLGLVEFWMEKELAR